MSEERDWLFTFHFGHAHPNKFVRIHGTSASARKEMIKRYGTKWSIQYPGTEEVMLTSYDMTELKE